MYNLFSIISFQHLSCPSNIRHRDSNPRPPEREPPPTTTRPVLPPVKVSLLVISCLDVSPQWLCLLPRRLCSNFFSNDQSFCQFHFSCIPVYYLCMEYTFYFCVPCHVCAFSYVSTYMSSFYSVIFELFVSLWISLFMHISFFLFFSSSLSLLSLLSLFIVDFAFLFVQYWMRSKKQFRCCTAKQQQHSSTFLKHWKNVR